MSVTWQCTKCPAYIKAVKYGEDSPEWHKFVVLRECLIYALLVTEFPAGSNWVITKKNWEEVYTRLDVLERTRGVYRTNTDGESIYFTPAEIESMIGLEVNAGTQTDVMFRNHLWRLSKCDAHRRLREHLPPG